MTDFDHKFDYKSYSLKQLENFLYDAMGAAEATPQEIYDVIKGAVENNYHTYKQQTANAYELLALLNGNGKGHIGGWDTLEKTYYPEEVRNDYTELMPNLQYTDEELTSDGSLIKEQY